MSRLCAGQRPTAGCPYYVSWDAFVVLGDDWINVYGGGYSVAGGTWQRLGEALIYPSSMIEQGYVGYDNSYYRSFGALKLNPRSGGGYTLTGFGGMWGREEGKNQAEPDEFPFFYIWSPEQGKVTTADIRFNFGGSLANTDYYINFGSRCGGFPKFSIVSCDPPVYLGTATPPPPPPKNMNCCDCNTIATILAEQAIVEIRQHQATRDLIDRRTLDGLREINKMLQNMQINLDLKPVIDRLNQLEANLWNGLNPSGGNN